MKVLNYFLNNLLNLVDGIAFLYKFRYNANMKAYIIYHR